MEGRRENRTEKETELWTDRCMWAVVRCVCVMLNIYRNERSLNWLASMANATEYVGWVVSLLPEGNE